MILFICKLNNVLIAPILSTRILYQELQIGSGWLDLALVLGVIALALWLSMWQGLNLSGSLITATGRAVLQLTVLGFVLDLGFSLNNSWGTFGLLMVLGIICSIVVRNRLGLKLRSLVWVFALLMLSMLTIVGYGICIVIRPDPWYAAPYWLGLGGVILGNSATVSFVAGESLLAQVKNNRFEIETHLCLGATPQQAMQSFRRQAIRAGVMPTINGLAIVGLVMLPQFLGGQLLSGIDPVSAVVYQLLLMVLMVTNAVMTAILIVEHVIDHCFNPTGQIID